MSKEYWETVKDDIRARRKIKFYFGQAAVPGTFTAEVYHDHCPMPLSVVWFGFSGLDCIQIQNSFTFEYVRRAGLRTYINEKLLESYPNRYILSGAGTESGEAWMKAAGYKKTKSGWEYRRKAK